jgi:CHAT domain-containing protein
MTARYLELIIGRCLEGLAACSGQILLLTALLAFWPVQASGQTATELLEIGTNELRLGNFPKAGARFEEAAALSGKTGEAGLRCEALIKLAHVRQMTGLYGKAIELLERARPLALAGNDRQRLAQIDGSIGNALLGQGDPVLAERYMLAGLALAEETGAGETAAAIRNNLGNLYSLLEKLGEAEKSYRAGMAMADMAGNAILAASAAVNLARLSLRTAPADTSRERLAEAFSRLVKADDSQAKALGLVNVGLGYAELGQRSPKPVHGWAMSAHDAFVEASAVAVRIGDMRTLSYAFGYLGSVYEGQDRLAEALELSRRAVFAAQQSGSPESLYRWHRQSGRILARMGSLDESIVSYRHSLRELKAVREEFANCYAVSNVSFQKTAGEVCSEMVDLLLRRASQLKEGETAEAWLEEARDTLEALKIYELREYFKDDCIDAARFTEKRLDAISPKTAVVYPILLPDRTELLVSTAGTLKRYTLPIGEEALTNEVREFRRKLVKRTTWEFLPHARSLYETLIRPMQADLEAAGPDTLVFVPGGSLRTIPMAALHDGTSFLIERYRIAVTPSMNLTEPRPLLRNEPKMFLLGLTKPVQGFPGLPFVDGELAGIRKLYGGSLLLNEEFRLANVEKGLKAAPFNIVHIASHGQFGDSVGDTFILAFDERFTMDLIGQYIGLFRFRDEPLDMLTLSACETAAGDDRAALGLAGVAVRAGARSALATLWHVNDPATQELILEFYRQLLNPEISRAAALQAAQLKMAGDPRYDHPGYWSSFLLINDWQ